MEAAGLVDESSQPSSNLAWFAHTRNACDSAQSKFEAKILEGRSLSSLLPSVSRTERVSDSPCQGKAVKVKSQVYDLMSSKPSESRSIPVVSEGGCRIGDDFMRCYGVLQFSVVDDYCPFSLPW